MIWCFFKSLLFCGIAVSWYTALLLINSINRTVVKREKKKKDTSFFAFSSIPDSISGVTRAPTSNAWMQGFAMNFPLWWRSTLGFSLSLLSGAMAVYYSSCPLHMIGNYAENRKRWKQGYLKPQIKNARLRKPQLCDCLRNLPSSLFLVCVLWQSC